MEELCFSTRSVIFHWNYNLNSFAPYRKRRLSAWAEEEQFQWTFA